MNARRKRAASEPRRRSNNAALTKAPTGVVGLDAVLRGGLPRGRVTVVFGGPGCGKTVLALQTLVNGARQLEEPAIFVAFEENSGPLIANAGSFGWDLAALQRDKLFFLDATLRPDIVHAGRFETTGILAGLEAKVRALRARRIVFDGIDVLLTLLDDPAAERAELYRIHEWLRRHDLTGIVTAKADGGEPFAHARYGFAAYMADCALLLERHHSKGVSERNVSVLKYRGSPFTENKSPFVIGPAGIEVAEPGAPTGVVRASTERLSTGVRRIDAMLGGGYLRFSSTLITGLPGTAKSTLSGAFARSALSREERVLYVTFDEQAEETVRNLASVGIRLSPFLRRRSLRIVSLVALEDNAEAQLMRIRSAVREHGAVCVVVDPISAIAKSSEASVSLGVLARFIHWSKAQGVTLVCTSVVSGSDARDEATELAASTLCDTWIHLAYAQRGGERNRSLSVIKSRGTAHSNQVRELVLSDEGIALADVYQAEGEVFMGTMRWEKESAERDASRRLSLEAQRRRLELERARAEIVAKTEALQRELAVNESELQSLGHGEVDRLRRAKARHGVLMDHRRADLDRARRGSGQRLGHPGKGG
jgi:circadian clock protein KaiC